MGFDAELLRMLYESNPAAYFIAAHLCLAGGEAEIPIREMSNKLNCAPSSIHRAIQKLIESGTVTVRTSISTSRTLYMLAGTAAEQSRNSGGTEKAAKSITGEPLTSTPGTVAEQSRNSGGTATLVTPTAEVKPGAAFTAADNVRRHWLRSNLNRTGSRLEQLQVIQAAMRGEGGVTEQELVRCIDIYKASKPSNEVQFLPGLLRYFGDGLYLRELEQVREAAKPKPAPKDPHGLAEAKAALFGTKRKETK